MRSSFLLGTIIAAGLLALPAAAQQTLPRPPSQMPPPGAQQKAPPPAPQGQKGAPQQKGAPPQQAQPRGRTARALHGADGGAAQALHRSGPCGLPQGARRRSRSEGSPGARQARSGAGLLLDQGKRQRRRQEDRHRGARDRAQPRRQGRLGLGVRSANSSPTKPPQPYPDRPNTVCSPAGPEFNPQDLEKLAETTKTDVGDWGFTSSDGIEVRATAAQNSPVIEKLGMQFVRVMPDTAPNASQDFMRIVTPSGKVGFVAAEAINPLGSDQLCFGKDASGAWKIVGMIGGG